MKFMTNNNDKIQDNNIDTDIETQKLKEEFTKKQKKAFVIFTVFLFLMSIFIFTITKAVVKPRKLPRLEVTRTIPAIRGNIVSQDNFNLAYSKKVFKAVVDTRCINPKKKELFIKLFSIYSGLSEEKIAKKLTSRVGSVVISYSINERNAKYLKELGYKLRKFKVFIPYRGNIFSGLDIIESGEKRVNNYRDSLTPILGYTTKQEKNNRTTLVGIKGLEKQYDEALNNMQNGFFKGKRDIISYINLNKESKIQRRIDGDDVVLNIPLKFQKMIEMILDKQKIREKADEIIACVMDSKTGKILSLATSNRYDPLNITKQDYINLQVHAIEYIYEPGSVMKPVTMALLFENNLVKMNDLVRSWGGAFNYGRHRVSDTHFDKSIKYLSIPYTIIHSSNVGIGQFAQRLSGSQFYYGLKSFGFTKKTNIDLHNERTGVMPSIPRLNGTVYSSTLKKRISTYKVTVSFGYGISTTFMQLMKAYNVFNNDGIALRPLLIDKIVQDDNAINLRFQSSPKRVISKKNARIIKNLLKRTVEEGTGKKARIDGLEIGGKTGTAHISVGHTKYAEKKYISSFFGYVNDKEHRYTIGVTVFKPKRRWPYYYASETAVPVFKDVVGAMMKYGYLEKEISSIK
jgi:cell division protein FtsI (penicillin-binding protein 3)